MGSTAEIFEFSTLELEIFASRKFFENAVRTDLVAHGELTITMRFISPAFMPDPNIVTVMEKFTTVASRNRAEELTAKTRLSVNEIGPGRMFRRATGGFLLPASELGGFFGGFAGGFFSGFLLFFGKTAGFFGASLQVDG